MSRILLVEDNAMNLDMLSRRLARKGYEVIAAPDGREGIAATHREQPDLILMDLGLPEINGLDATRSLKKDASTREIPIIALTAHAMQGDRELALAAGCDDYDTKPVDLARLMAKMEFFLKEKSFT